MAKIDRPDPKALDKAVSAMTSQGRVAMGQSFYDGRIDSRPSTDNVMLRPRGSKAAQDPNGPTGHRHGTEYREGPQWRITANLKGAPVAPEAQHTQANGRVVSSAVNRSTPAFMQGTSGQHLY